MRVVVAGAGVIGLLCAHELAHGGHTVTVVARERGQATTSARAGASFKPSTVSRAHPYRALLEDSRAVLERWEASGFGAAVGISRTTHVEASVRPLAAPDYLDVMGEVRWLRAASGDDVPGGYPYALSYETFFYDVPVALAAMADHLADEHGVEDAEATLASLDGRDVTARGAEVVVNATGLGARELAEDPEVVPVRGQTVLVGPEVGDPGCSMSADGLYCYPRSDGILLGGTRERDVWDTAPDPGAVQLLLRANSRLLPGLLDARPVRADAGLRPYRPSGIRVEVDGGRRVPVVHAYGHGGAGWTLAPGTARWVARAVADLRR